MQKNKQNLPCQTQTKWLVTDITQIQYAIGLTVGKATLRGFGRSSLVRQKNSVRRCIARKKYVPQRSQDVARSVQTRKKPYQVQ